MSARLDLIRRLGYPSRVHDWRARADRTPRSCRPARSPCRSETRLPTANACQDWAQDLLELASGATSVVITLHPGAGPAKLISS